MKKGDVRLGVQKQKFSKFLNEMEISKKDEIDIYKCDNPETEVY